MIKRAAGFIIYRCINEEIQYLLLKASYGNFHWSTPKGHVDEGEDDYTTALRETLEESGYEETDLCVNRDVSHQLEYKVRGEDKIVTYWLAKLIASTKEPKLSDEHTEFRWLNKENTFKLITHPEFIEMFNLFHNVIVKETIV